MKALYDNIGFIVGFLVLILLLQSFAGTKFTRSVLLLVLLSQLVLNPTVVTQFFNPTKSDMERDIEEGLNASGGVRT